MQQNEKVEDLFCAQLLCCWKLWGGICMQQRVYVSTIWQQTPPSCSTSLVWPREWWWVAVTVWTAVFGDLSATPPLQLLTASPCSDSHPSPSVTDCITLFWQPPHPFSYWLHHLVLTATPPLPSVTDCDPSCPDSHGVGRQAVQELCLYHLYACSWLFLFVVDVAVFHVDQTICKQHPGSWCCCWNAAF